MFLHLYKKSKELTPLTVDGLNNVKTFKPVPPPTLETADTQWECCSDLGEGILDKLNFIPIPE